MTDHTTNGFHGRGARTFEYKLYFAVIFLISLPICFVSCTLGLRRPEDEELESRFFFRRAWQRASVITPMIFSA